ncbi:nickel insertion protein [Streptosporangium sp. NPDC006007]|uniref:nickel insertion protein n=1 Tax=Streptosporangium sp. NPDC006007 TaxID=3154575 RepID=UPI0033A6DA86
MTVQEAVDDVDFNEVNGLDPIGGVVGACMAHHTLGISTASSTPMALGIGRAKSALGGNPIPTRAVRRPRCADAIRRIPVRDVHADRRGTHSIDVFSCGGMLLRSIRRPAHAHSDAEGPRPAQTLRCSSRPISCGPYGRRS